MQPSPESPYQHPELTLQPLTDFHGCAETLCLYHALGTQQLDTSCVCGPGPLRKAYVSHLPYSSMERHE